MRFLLTGGTVNKLKPDYIETLERRGHTGDIFYPGGPAPDTGRYGALLLTGGSDITPKRFGAELLPNGSETLDTARDDLEFALFDVFVRQGKPVLGICRGMQVVNVALGGTLWQDLPSQCGLNHGDTEHEVRFDGGMETVVNSFHHQAVRCIGNGLKVTALSADGVIEALESEDTMIRAVQWHPEKGCYGMEYLLKGLNE
jgi:putative glutamine amidotransferase